MVSLINKRIKHTGALGVGTVIEQDDKYITVEFASKTCKFAYPTAFEKFLVALDPADAEKNEEIKLYVAKHNDGMKVSNLYIVQ